MDEANWISLVATREAETGEWLGADLIESESYERDDYDGDHGDWDADYESDKAEGAYTRHLLGD